MGILVSDFEQMKARTQQAILKKAEPKESELHAKIREYCKDQWPRWKFIECRMDKRSTIAVGAQDFTIFRPDGKVLCVECKRRGQKLSQEQKAWKKEMEMLEHHVFVIHGWEGFIFATNLLEEKP
jgi:hypothetical protein